MSQSVQIEQPARKSNRKFCLGNFVCCGGVEKIMEVNEGSSPRGGGGSELGGLITESITLTRQDSGSNCIVDSSAGAIDITLPVARPGLSFSFTVTRGGGVITVSTSEEDHQGALTGTVQDGTGVKSFGGIASPKTLLIGAGAVAGTVAHFTCAGVAERVVWQVIGFSAGKDVFNVTG